MKLIVTVFSAVALLGFAKFSEDSKLFKSIKDLPLVKPAPNFSETAVMPAGEGKITGKVFVNKSSGTKARSTKGLYGKSASKVVQNSGSDRQAVVFIEKVSGQFPVPQSRPVMRQKNITIVPHVLPVLIGSTVDFPNEDQIYHNIFSLSSVKSFDLGRYAKGKSKSVTFNKFGEVKVFCDIHSSMSGYIIVLQNPYFATTGTDGSYAITGVPSGNYKVGAWHENGGTQWQTIAVESGQTVTADFSF